MVAFPLTIPLFFRTAWIAAAHIDTQATTVLVILLVLLLGFSFAISGAEVAFFSLTSKDINLLKTKQQPAYKRIVDLLENPRLLLASLIIANCIANIAIIIIANIVLDDLVVLDPSLTWVRWLIKIISLTILLLLFCEVMPKVMATQNNIRFAKDVGFLVESTGYVINWLSKIAIRYLDITDGKLGGGKNELSLEEIDEAIDKSATAETSEKEKSILKGIAKFGSITVKQIMKTRVDVNGIEQNTSFAQLVTTVEDLHYSRLPVYKENLDEVTGIINTKDLLPYLNSEADFDWHFLMRPPLFVHEQKLIEDLLKEFQSKRIHIAVVVDEFGGTSGIVTLEDILEEVIGDIRDEFDEEEEATYTKIDDHTFIFDGKTIIYDVCKAMNISSSTFDQVKGDSDSLAGLVLELAGEIPKKDQVVHVGDFDFTVIELEKNRLQKIKVSYQTKA
ncbi:gliding motility-associated protein GldE [Filimonas lacunae]|uniref:Gliding motility-associated protein GldE n=1 Tax=Filimonas lacunae TaxID=477680 RepID=A0A173MPK5_9BACT|nr:gliding motility-associated protein GldE [Filimonas lacunae]BAV09321.1 magnesium and cobalt efflux protein CorC [Filimonas lacunae]SIS71097.1 gliding motility-associated protein GldE [Filimonas lacunae]